MFVRGVSPAGEIYDEFKKKKKNHASPATRNERHASGRFASFCEAPRIVKFIAIFCVNSRRKTREDELENYSRIMKCKNYLLKRQMDNFEFLPS